jgi:xylulokinase
MLDFLGISEDKLPELLKSGVPVGSLTAEASAATGLTSKTICVSGAYDHPSGAIGTGNMQSGDVTLTIGASMAMCVAIDKPITDISYKIPCQCHVVDGLFFLLPYGQTAGMVLKWFRNEFCKAEIDIAREKGEDAYDLIVKEAALVPPGCDGLIMLPHLMGAGTPEYNSNARGVFAGIDISMKKGHFTRAIIESVSMMIHNNLERLKEQGINVKSLYVLGGGSRSKLWNQILADITGLVFITLSSSENAAIGAAMLAGVGTGIYENLREATKVSIKAFERIKPNIKNHEKYKEVFKKYLKLYQSLENYW